MIETKIIKETIKRKIILNMITNPKKVEINNLIEGQNMIPSDNSQLHQRGLILK